MKKSLFFILLGLSSLFSEEAVVEKIHWYTDYAEAEKVSEEKKIPLFLFFSGSDWCPWCKKLKKKIFDKPEFYQELKDLVVFCLIDFPMKTSLGKEIMAQNESLMKEYSVEGFPTVVLIDLEKGLITKVGYLPVSAEEYADCVKEVIEDFYSLDDDLEEPDCLSLRQWEKLATRAKILGSPYYNNKLQQVGMKSCPSPIFLLEKYEAVIKKVGLDAKEAIVLKKKILQLDPSEIYKSHYKLALLEFYTLSEMREKSSKRVIEPLISYIESFGKKNAQLWKVHLLIAHFLFSRNEVKEALHHAKISFKLAPEKIRKELADTIASFKEK